MSVDDAKTLSAWRALVQAAQHVIEGRDCGNEKQRRERLEAAAISAKVALGLLAEVQPATVGVLAPIRLSPKAAVHWRELRALWRRVEEGISDEALDAELERLAGEWHCLSDEDAEALRALMLARRGGQVDRAAQLRLADEIERKAAAMKPGNPPEDGRKYRVVTDEGLETVVWYDNPGGFPFQNGVNSFETDEIPWHDPVPVEDDMSERVELSNEIKALGLEHCKSEQEVLTQATAEAIAGLTEEELREFVRDLEGEVLSLRGQIALGNLRARGDLALGLTALGATGGSASGSAEVALRAPQGASAGGGEAVVRKDALDED